MVYGVMMSPIRTLRFKGEENDLKAPECKDGVCSLPPAKDAGKPVEAPKAPEPGNKAENSTPEKKEPPKLNVPFYLKPFVWIGSLSFVQNIVIKIATKLVEMNTPAVLKSEFGYEIDPKRDKTLVKELKPDTFDAEVLASKEPVLVDFWAPWCMPCKLFTPALEQTANDYKGKLKVCKLNVEAYPEMQKKFGFEGIPTLILFQDGKEAQRLTGVPKKAVLNEALDKALS